MFILEYNIHIIIKKENIMESKKRKTVSFNLNKEDEILLNEIIKNNIYINSMSHLVEIAIFEFIERYKEKDNHKDN